MAFFDAIRRSDDVFRYEIFNRDGYSQLVSDRDKIALVDVSEFNSEAARAAATGQLVVDARHSDAADLPSFFARAFVPVVIDNRAIGVVGTFVDQTEIHDIFQKTFLIATMLLCLLIGLAFSIPAIAWYRRSIEKQRADRRIPCVAAGPVDPRPFDRAVQSPLSRGGLGARSCASPTERNLSQRHHGRH